MSRKTVIRYESGETEPKSLALESLASALGVSPTWLSAGDESPTEGQGNRADSGEPSVPPSTRAAPDELPSGRAYVEYPMAPNGHGADVTGRENEDATPTRVRLPRLLMQRLTGGRAPAVGFWTFAAGTSAEPFIPEGSPVFVEPIDGPLVEGGRYAIWLGEAEADVIKRLTVGTGGSVTLYGDNAAVPARTFFPTDDDGEWREGGADGPLMSLTFRGKVTFPLDTASAIVGQIRAAIFAPRP